MSRNLFVIRIWLVLTIIAISLTGTQAFAQGATIVRVDPTASSAQVNDRVETHVKVDNITSLVAFEIHLAFDPRVLEVIEVTNGGFVAADFTAQNTFDNVAGTIDYAVAQMNRAPATGSGVLIHIAFRAKAGGSTAVALRSTQAAPGGLLLSDENGVGIQASWADGIVNVSGSATGTVTATPVAPPANTVTRTPVTPGSTTVTPTLTPITPSALTATPTPTITRTNTPADSTLPTTRIHIVRSGETLFCIGRAYRVWPFAIAEVNGIWWPYTIYPNQKLTIPATVWSPIPAGPICAVQFATPGVTPSTPVTPTITPTPTSTTVSSTCRAIYFVRPGDTLYRIAVSYGTNYTELARVNQLPNPRLIYVGQRLCIP